ncbi:unnamed protein product, partial [Effrenium voratum]
RYPSSFSGGSFVVPPGGSYVPPVAYMQPSGSFVAPPGYVPPALGSSSYVPPIGTGSYVPPVTGSYVPPLATSGSFDGFGFPSTGSFVAPPGPVGLAKLRNKEFKFYVKPPNFTGEKCSPELAVAASSAAKGRASSAEVSLLPLLPAVSLDEATVESSARPSAFAKQREQEVVVIVDAVGQLLTDALTGEESGSSRWPRKAERRHRSASVPSELVEMDAKEEPEPQARLMRSEKAP